MFSPDETHIMLRNNEVISIYSFPDLAPIMIDTVQHNDAGFLPGEDRYYHILATMDTLFVVDYSNPESKVTTAVLLESPPDSPIGPYMGVVDFERDLIILVCEPLGEFSYIHVRDAIDFSFVQQNVAPVHYHNKVFLRPHSDEVFMYSILAGWGWQEMDRLDYYSTEFNTISSFIKKNDFRTEAPRFAFDNIEFTPDGETIYLGRGIPLGIHIADKKIIQRLQPEISAARVIRINPGDFSQ
jgi:hypothetical protein